MNAYGQDVDELAAMIAKLRAFDEPDQPEPRPGEVRTAQNFIQYLTGNGWVTRAKIADDIEEEGLRLRREVTMRQSTLSLDFIQGVESAAYWLRGQR